MHDSGRRRRSTGRPSTRCSLDDLLDVTRVYVAIPDGLGVDDDDRAVLALIEAAGLVGPDFMLQAGIFDRIFEG